MFSSLNEFNEYKFLGLIFKIISAILAQAKCIKHRGYYMSFHFIEQIPMKIDRAPIYTSVKRDKAGGRRALVREELKIRVEIRGSPATDKRRGSEKASRGDGYGGGGESTAVDGERSRISRARARREWEGRGVFIAAIKALQQSHSLPANANSPLALFRAHLLYGSGRARCASLSRPRVSRNLVNAD